METAEPDDTTPGDSAAESVRGYITAMNDGIAARFDGLEAKVDEGFAAVNSRIDGLAAEVGGVKATTDALFDATADNTRKLRERD